MLVDVIKFKVSMQKMKINQSKENKGNLLKIKISIVNTLTIMLVHSSYGLLNNQMK